jgi:hypothetical protein
LIPVTKPERNNRQGFLLERHTQPKTQVLCTPGFCIGVSGWGGFWTDVVDTSPFFINYDT